MKTFIPIVLSAVLASACADGYESSNAGAGDPPTKNPTDVPPPTSDDLNRAVAVDIVPGEVVELATDSGDPLSPKLGLQGSWYEGRSGARLERWELTTRPSRLGRLRTTSGASLVVCL